MMIHKTRAFAVLASLALVATIGTTTFAESEPEPAELTGIEWRLTSITADGTTSVFPDGVTSTLLMEAGEAGGAGGCNGFFGSYHVDGLLLSFGPIGSTQMFCEGPEQAVEDAYLAALGEVAYWGITDDGSLSLQDAEQMEVLSFTSAGTGIEGITWLLRSQSVDGTLTNVPDGVLVSLRLLDGQAGGNGGCNRYSTSYLIDGDNIEFGQLATTLMACEDPAGELEGAYFANLAATATWSSDGTNLTFASADGADILVYEAAAEASVVGSWIASGINNGTGGVVNSAITSSVTADFSPEGDLTGFDGCNDYFTTYEVDGDSIVISDAIGSTRMACADDDLAAQSQQYTTALAAATTWSIDDRGNLQLRDDGGSLQVEYVPAAA